MAYVFGNPPKSVPGRRVMSGEYTSSKPDVARIRLTAHKEYGRPVPGLHPTPRRYQHVEWLIGKWMDGIILDPFAGSGTTLLAAKNAGGKAIGIEIEEKYCEIAAKRMVQDVLDFGPPAGEKEGGK